MEKKCPSGGSSHNGLPLKTILLMRFSFAAILLAISLHLSAFGFSQERVSVNFKKARLEKALKVIEEQSSYRFVFSSLIIPQETRVTFSADDIKVEDLLVKMLSGTGLQFNVSSSGLVVISKDPGFVTPPPVVIKGKITDEQGSPLAGVSVTGKKSKKGTTTDELGNFSLEVEADETLEITSVGFATQTLKVGTRNENLTITLQKAANDMGEVIVVGYGTTTRGKNITSVSTINPAKITNLGVATVGEALAGRVPGLIVTNSGGGPGKVPFVSIRGGNAPIFIIDDIPSSADQFNQLNVNDIENISFLKDGPATAVYGFAAGDGLVLVKTKRGAKGKLAVNYNYGYTLSQPTFLAKKLGSYELATYINNVYKGEGNATGPFPDADVQKFKDQSDPLNFPNNDWQDLVLKNFAPQSNHNLSLNGGNNQMQYYASFGYMDQGTLYKFNTNWLKRYNYRLSVTGNFEKIGLKTTMALYGVNELQRNSNSGYGSGYFAVWSHIQNRAPWDKAFSDLERTKYSNQGDHPIVEIDPRSGYSKSDNRDINGLLNVDWAVPHVKGLSVRGNANLRQRQSFSKSWNATAPQYAIGGTIPVGGNQPGLSQGASNGYNYVLQGFLVYERQIRDHGFYGQFGYEEAYDYGEGLSAGRNSYIFSNDQLFAGPPSSATNNGNAGESVRSGWIGRFKYDYSDRYFAEFSFRYDGSDLFPATKRSSLFPGGAVGWVISNEKFFNNLKSGKVFNYLRARASYGSVGQNSGVGSFAYLPGYTSGGGYVVNGVLSPTLNSPAIPSPDISWFSQYSTNLGIDYGFFNNKLSGSVDYFYLETRGYLASPSNVGYTDPLGTALPTRRSNGVFRRGGYDFGIKYTDNIGKLGFTLGSNFTKFDQLWENNPFEDSATLKNPYTTSYYQRGFLQTGYVSAGLYQNSADIINYPRRTASTVAPGDIKYQDVNGDGKLDGDDFRRIGKATFPRVNYGFTADLTYGAWFLNMLWQGSGKRSIYLGDVIQTVFVDKIRYEFQTKNHWTPGAGNTLYPRIISSEGINGSHNSRASDFWVVNAGYLRLKALQLGYNFKKVIAKNANFITDLRLTLSGTNLITFSKITQFGLDPETGSNNNYDYPSQRAYSLSLNLGF